MRTPSKRLREIPWLAGLPTPAADAIRGAIRYRDVPADEILHEQGQETTEQTEAFWGVLSGSVKLHYSTDNDGRVAVTFFHAGTWIGAAAAMTGRQRLMSIITSSPSEIAYVRRADFVAVTKEHPHVWRVPMWIIAQNFIVMMDRIGALMVNDAKDRLRRVLLGMCPPRSSAAWPVTLQLTQEELALSANLTSRTVRKLLADLQHEGVIETSYKQIKVL